MARPHVFDSSELTFERDVLEASRETPIVVDFWAAWCAPCRALGPVLERLAAEANGEWRLAKVDVDANPGLAAALRVQGIPAVRAFKDGRQVAEFVGALPEPQVRQWLGQLGPSPAELAYQAAAAAEAEGDDERAAAGYRQALEHDPGHAAARSALARVELKLRAGWVQEGDLKARLAADPTDLDAVLGLADLEAARGELGAAFSRLLEVVRSTQGEERDRARKHLVALLDTVPADDARAVAARRSLAAALY